MNENLIRLLLISFLYNYESVTFTIIVIFTAKHDLLAFVIFMVTITVTITITTKHDFLAFVISSGNYNDNDNSNDQ